MAGPDIRHFVVLSLALHAGVLIYTAAPDPEMPGPAGPLRLTLMTETPVPSGRQPDSTVNRTRAGSAASGIISGTTAPAVTPVRRPPPPATGITTATAVRKVQERSTATEPRRSPPAAGISRASLEAELRGQLRRALLPHFRYPLLARRRGWEGIVRVGVRIEADGTLTGLHLVEGSHHAVLNRAAMESLRRVAQLPQAGTRLGSGHVDLVLPIEYRLTDTRGNG